MSVDRSGSLPPSIRVRRRWRTVSWPLVVLIVAGAIMLRERLVTHPAATGDRERYHNQSFRVAKVVDGDTLDIQVADLTTGQETTRLRLWGVDTPEIGRGGKSTMHFGDEASAFAKGTLLDQKVRIVLAPKRTRGRYGRLLAYVHLEPGGEMFNEMLIREGFAYADSRFEHPFKRAFGSLERAARRGQLGLWQDIQIEQMPAWRQRVEKRKRP